jgi:hypothetical protein
MNYIEREIVKCPVCEVNPCICLTGQVFTAESMYGYVLTLQREAEEELALIPKIDEIGNAALANYAFFMGQQAAYQMVAEAILPLLPSH